MAMTLNYKTILLFVFTCAALLQDSAFAQNDTALNKLEGYVPPPMFDTNSAPLTAPINAAPISIEDEPGPLLPPPKPELQTEKLSTTNLPPAEIHPVPPIPKRRPTIFHASKSFIEKARQDFQDSGNAGGPPPDSLENALSTPSAKDVLASIDPETAEIMKNKPAQNITKIKPDSLPIVKDTISLGYLPEVTELTDQVKPDLIQTIFVNTQAAPETRIEVRAFASVNPEEGQSSARRIALARALNVRSFLIENNISSKIIDIRALGNNTDKQPVDRVDIVFIRDNAS